MAELTLYSVKSDDYDGLSLAEGVGFEPTNASQHSPSLSRGEFT